MPIHASIAIPQRTAVLKGVWSISALVSLIALSVLMGWMLSNETLKSISPAWVAMKANTAVGLFLCGILLGLCALNRHAKLPRKWPRWVVNLLSFTVIFFSALTLGQDLFGLRFGIDEALFMDNSLVLETSHPGRMAPASALSFILAAVGLFVTNGWLSLRMALPLTRAMAITLICIALFVLMNYAMDLITHSRWSDPTGMAAHTAICFLILGVGIFLLSISISGFQWFLDARSSFGFAMGILLLLMISHTVFTHTARLRQTAVMVTDRYQLLERIHRIGTGTALLESSERGYLITGNPALLEDRARITQDVIDSLRQASTLAAEDPLQQKRTEELEKVTRSRLQSGENVILTLQREGFDTAARLVDTSEGKILSARLLELLGEISRAEYVQQKRDQEAAHATTITAFLLLPVQTLLCLALLLIWVFFLNAGMGDRIKVEQKLRSLLKQEKDLRNALDEHAIVSIIDPQWRITFVNDKFCAISHYAREELIGSDHRQLLESTHGNEQFVQEICSTISSGKVWKGEVKNRAKDGTFFWVDTTVVPFINDDGSIRHYITIRTDITASKLLQESLRESQEDLLRERSLLRAIIDTIPDLIFIKDVNSVFMGSNKAHAQYLGTTEEEIIGRTHFDFLPSDFAKSYQQMDQMLFATGEPQELEESVTDEDGKTRIFEIHKTAYYGPDGETLGLVGVCRDITRRRQNEEEMRQLLDRMQMASRAAQVGIWELDLASGKGKWDEQMYTLSGVDASDQDLGWERWFQLMAPEDRPGCEQALEEALQTGQSSFDITFHITRPSDQARRFIHSIGVIQRDTSGRAIRMVGCNRDNTLEQQREAELSAALEQEKILSKKARSAEQAKSDFLAVMSHELRTPLNGIIGFADLLARNASLSEDCRSQATTIHQSGEALLHILDDILDFSCLEADKLTVTAVPFQPRPLIRDILHLLSRQAADKNLNFSMTVDPGVAETLVGDAGRIRQILLNLMGNALKFTDHGWVTAHLRLAPEHPGCYEFSVEDSGPGIPEDKIETIFEPFTQENSTISRNHGGTGLGLTICRRLTSLMGGTLTVTSSVGCGARFSLILPLDSDSPALSAVAADDPLDETFAKKHPLQILLVDDDRVNLKLLQSITRRLGYQALTATNGEEAFEICQVHHPDCVFMDLQMPVMDGISATIKIRTHEKSCAIPHAFISALTANTIPADRQRCMDAGMNNYLNKPFKPQALARIIIQACDLRDS